MMRRRHEKKTCKITRISKAYGIMWADGSSRDIGAHAVPPNTYEEVGLVSLLVCLPAHLSCLICAFAVF